MLLSPRHGKGNLTAARWARHRGFCLGGEREQQPSVLGERRAAPHRAPSSRTNPRHPAKGPPQHPLGKGSSIPQGNSNEDADHPRLT